MLGSRGIHCTGTSQVTGWRCCAHPSVLSARSSEAVYNDTDLGAANMESYDPKGVTLGKLRDQAKCGFYVYKLGLMLLSAIEGY